MTPKPKPKKAPPVETPKTGRFYGGMKPVDQLPEDHPEKVRERKEKGQKP